MKKNTNKNLAVNQLLETIKEGSPEKVNLALLELSKIGNLSIIPQLHRILMSEPLDVNKKMISEFISNIQDPGIVKLNMDFLRDHEIPEKLIAFTPCIWNSKHDYSRYISDFVSLAVEGDYLMALECLTIIEQMNGPFEESWLLESQLFLKEYIESGRIKDQKKDYILSDIAHFIKTQNNGVDADLLLE